MAMKKIWMIPLIMTMMNAAEHRTFSLKELSAVQPGMGTVMMEYGHRFYVLYYAAKAENWELAAYELHEQLEIQEVGETTRPGYAKKLKAFEDTYLLKLEKAVKMKKWPEFEKLYAEVTKACNQCHVETGHGYIRYQLPDTPPTMLKMELK
jgi:hypothetical protein